MQTHQAESAATTAAMARAEALLPLYHKLKKLRASLEDYDARYARIRARMTHEIEATQAEFDAIEKGGAS